MTFTTSAVDLVDGNSSTVCAPTSGSVFPVGTTAVQCTATDQAGNTGTGTLNVTVTATDQGESGKRRDTFSLVIEDARGRIVASVDGELDRGNIQSTRLR